LGHDECLTPDSVRDGGVRNAQQDDVGAVLAQLNTPLFEASGDSRADTAAADDVDTLDHVLLQFRVDTGQNTVYPAEWVSPSE
jgi:hypothetical protein